MYFADNIEPVNRFLSYIQFEIIEFGTPAWIPDLLILLAAVTLGILLGQFIQKSAGNLFFAKREAQGTTAGQMAGGFLGFLFGLFVLTDQGYFEKVQAGGWYPDLATLLINWLIFVGPIVVGVLAGSYLHRLIRK